MKRTIIFLIYSLAITAMGLIFYFGLNLNPQYTTKSIIGVDVPNFSTQTLINSSTNLSNEDLQYGKYSLINIWASWCVTCKKEHKFLMKLSQATELDIYGINFKDKRENAISFLNELGNPFLITGIDNNGSLSINLGAYGIPESILIDKNKKIIAKYIGPINKGDYKEILSKIKN